MIITFLLFSLLLAFNIWFFFVWPKKAFGDKIATVLQIIAVYTFGLGVLTQIGVLPALKSLAPELTSPDLLRFLAGNMNIAAIGFQGLSVALEPSKTAFSATIALEGLYLLLLTPIAILGFVAYAIFVMPWAYLAYAFVSIPVNAVLTSGVDHCLSLSGPSLEESTYCFKEGVQSNTAGFKSFLIALPAVTVAFALKLFRNFSGTWVKRSDGKRLRESKNEVLRKVSIYALWGGQGFAALLLLLTISMSLPSLFVIEAEPGEIYGSTVVILLTIAIEVALFRQIGLWRRAYQNPTKLAEN